MLPPDILTNQATFHPWSVVQSIYNVTIYLACNPTILNWGHVTGYSHLSAICHVFIDLSIDLSINPIYRSGLSNLSWHVFPPWLWKKLLILYQRRTNQWEYLDFVTAVNRHRSLYPRYFSSAASTSVPRHLPLWSSSLCRRFWSREATRRRAILSRRPGSKSERLSCTTPPKTTSWVTTVKTPYSRSSFGGVSCDKGAALAASLYPVYLCS